MAYRNVLVIITGGTICMRPSILEGSHYAGLACAPLEEYLRAQPELKDRALPHYSILEWKQLIDSSDVTEVVWCRIARDIQENYEKYDGFVILHGTDTLAYTATALAFMLEQLGKPVVITGAMLPMSHIHTDARSNVAVSLMVAGFSEIPEVLVVFGTRILRGCRTSKIDCTAIDAFQSPNYAALGAVGIDITINKHAILDRPTGKFTIFTDMVPSSIVVVTLTPACDPLVVDCIAKNKAGPLAIILQLFGTGTAPMKRPGFMDSIRNAIAAGVTIVAVTQCSSGTCSLQTYENGQLLHKIGVIEGKDLTLEGAFGKLAYLMGKGYRDAELRHLMETDMRGEMSERVSKVTGQGTLGLAEVESGGSTDSGTPTATLDIRRHSISEMDVRGNATALLHPFAPDLTEGVTLVESAHPKKSPASR